MEAVQVPVHDLEGRVIATMELSPEVFGIEPNEAVLHQAMIYYRANARRGTADTKTRAQVSGGGAKPFRQKGTGRARQGSVRAPQFRGGGVVFGPHPRSYRQRLPKKMGRLALCSALSARVAQSRLVVVDRLSMAEPKTRAMVGLLGRLGVKASALIVTSGVDRVIYKAAANLPRVRVLPAYMVNTLDVLNHECVVVSREGVEVLEARLGEGRAQEPSPAEASGPPPSSGEAS